MREDPVPHLLGQVQPFGDPQRLLVVSKPPAETFVQRAVERILARVTEGRMAGVVAEPDRFDEILVQAQRARDDAGDRRRLERMRHARAVVVAGRVDEDLRLPLQSPERLRVKDPVAVTLEGCADRAFCLGLRPATGLVRADGQRRERVLFERPHASGERICDPPCDFGHEVSVAV